MADNDKPLFDPVLFEDTLEELEQTEVVQVVRRPGMGETVEVDYDDVDADIAIAMLVRGIIGIVIDDLFPDEDEEDEDEDEEDQE